MNKKLINFLLLLSLLVIAGSVSAAGPVGWPIGQALPEEPENLQGDTDQEDLGQEETLLIVLPFLLGGQPVGVVIQNIF